MCKTTGPIHKWCEPHRRRYYSYEHIGLRPVVTRVEFGYGAKPTEALSLWASWWGDSGEHAITVFVELRWSKGKARLRPPWWTVFCLRDRPDLSGDGVRQVVCNMVKQEIKRLGWGYARGVRCQP